MQVMSNKTIKIHVNTNQNDILFANIEVNSNIGIILIDFSRRARIRINGIASILDNQTIEITTEQVYGNCPKYIQARVLNINSIGDSQKMKTLHDKRLSNLQRGWIEKADTFFISSSNAKGKTDASHRGGEVGFIHVVDDKTLQFPDYVGNNIFNTLGNIVENPKTGLLFLDFEKGHTLQLTGEIEIIWDISEEDKVKYPGAMRLLKYKISHVIENSNAYNYFWDFLSYSPYNPKQGKERGI